MHGMLCQFAILASGIAKWVVCYLVPGTFKLGFGRFGRWYDRNGYFRFKVGDTLELRNRKIFGFGVRPVGRVVGFDRDSRYGFSQDYYRILMETDANGNFFDWSETGDVPPGTKRTCKVERHFKWNVEHKLRLVAEPPVYAEALTLAQH